MTDSGRFQELVDDQRYDELLTEVTTSDIAATWMRYQRSGAESVDHPDWWAVELWIDPDWWEHDERLVRDGVLALVAICQTDDEFDLVGAAVMEVLVEDDEDRLRWIEEQAAASPAFRRSLADVWIWDEPDHVFQRVERAAGVPLTRPAGE
jgi:hypothetical protein